MIIWPTKSISVSIRRSRNLTKIRFSFFCFSSNNDLENIIWIEGIFVQEHYCRIFNWQGDACGADGRVLIYMFDISPVYKSNLVRQRDQKSKTDLYNNREIRRKELNTALLEFEKWTDFLRKENVAVKFFKINIWTRSFFNFCFRNSFF